MSKKFKITGIGIDTTRLNDVRFSFDRFRYVHTTPKAGNEYILKSEIKDYHTLITTVDFLDQIETVVPNHLRELGRNSIDLLLIDSKCRIEDNVDVLNNLIISGMVSEIGISNPESTRRLDELRNKISQISYVSLDICPLNFGYSIIKYCEANDIKILGFNPFGGRINYPRLIESFTVPYLLAFSGAYSDIVFLSDHHDINSECEYLSELIDQEYNEKEFEITQDVSKLLKEPKKTIFTSIKLDDGSIIPYTSRDTYFSYQESYFGIGKPGLTLTAEEEKDNLETSVYDFYKEFSGGPADKPSPENTMMFLRYRILDLARIEYPEIDGWFLFWTPIDSTTFTISGVRTLVEKRFLRIKKTIEQFNYIVAYTGTELIFRKLKNAEKTE